MPTPSWPGKSLLFYLLMTTCTSAPILAGEDFISRMGLAMLQPSPFCVNGQEAEM